MVNTERLVFLIDQHLKNWNAHLDRNPQLATPDLLFQHNHVMNTLAIIRRTAENAHSLEEVNVLTEATRIIIRDNDPELWKELLAGSKHSS
jgi:hypothetical protein